MITVSELKAMCEKLKQEAITVSELKAMCEEIEQKYGGNSEVYIQIRDKDGRLLERDHCRHLFHVHADGTLYLSNVKPLKN